MDVRYPAVADAFYPADGIQLRSMIEGYFSKAVLPKNLKGKLRGVIVPHAGYVYSGPVAAYAYKLLQETKSLPQRFLMLGPSHYARFPGLAESDSSLWRTPLGDVSTFSLRSCTDRERIKLIPAAHHPEHSLEVQLPFLQFIMDKKPFSISPILTGDVLPDDSKLLEPFCDSFFIVSSDLSHYLPYSQAVALDSQTISLIEKLDLDNFIYEGDACGKAGISIIMDLARKKGWSIKLLHYANSGDTSGSKDKVVGYAALAILEVD